MIDSEETARTQRRYDRQAATYNLTEMPLEWLVFGRLRRALWSVVPGIKMLEIGVGTGKNLPCHPQGAQVVAVDFSPKMLRRAQARAQRLGRRIDLVLADAQRLPFRDGVFDAAAATFVFCSVPDPVLGLREARRVVRPGGTVHLLEHVRATNPVAAKMMDLLNPLARRVTGANVNRDTVTNVTRAGIALTDVVSRFGIVKLMRGRVPESLVREERSEDVARV